jgi:hypothetical protein
MQPQYPNEGPLHPSPHDSAVGETGVTLNAAVVFEQSRSRPVTHEIKQPSYPEIGIQSSKTLPVVAQAEPNTAGYPVILPGAMPDAGMPVQQQPSFADEASTRMTQPKDEEEDQKKKEEEDYYRKVSFLQLFRYTSISDRFLILLAAACASGNGGTRKAQMMSFRYPICDLS